MDKKIFINILKPMRIVNHTLIDAVDHYEHELSTVKDIMREQKAEIYLLKDEAKQLKSALEKESKYETLIKDILQGAFNRGITEITLSSQDELLGLFSDEIYELAEKYRKVLKDKINQATRIVQLEKQARVDLGIMLRAGKRTAAHKAKATKANAEKRLLMKIIGEGIEKGFEAQEILYLYQLELKQRRKKSRKGGKCE